MNQSCHNIPVILVMICFIALSQPPTAGAGVRYNFEPINEEFDSIARQLLGREFYHRASSRTPADLQRLARIAQAKGDNSLRARALFWQVRTGQITGAPNQCIRLLEKARSLSGAEHDYDNAFINYQLAGNYQRLGKYFTAYQLLQQAIPVFDKYRDDYALGNAYLLMGLTYGDISEPALAAENIEKAKLHYARANFPLNRIYFFEALTQTDKAKSIALYEKSASCGAHEPAMTVQALVNLSDIYLNRNQADSARTHLDEATAMVERSMPDNKLYRSMLLRQQAALAMHDRDYRQVIDIIDNAQQMLKEYPGEYLEPQLYLLKSQAYEGLGMQAPALEYLKKYQHLQDSSMKQVASQEIPKAREREAIAHNKEMIAQIQQQEKTQRAHLYIWLLALALLLLSVAAWLVWNVQRLRVKKIENQSLREGLEKEMIIARFNRENFEKDLQQKACQISSSVLLLSNKNEVLQQIGDITRQWGDDGKIPPEYVKRINEVVGHSLRSDDEWSRFKQHFDSVHPAFFDKLKELSPELTQNDLRLCAYLRVGLRAKEIAEMLAVSAASVNTNRYRLRKKLGLAKEDSLDDYIRKI